MRSIALGALAACGAFFLAACTVDQATNASDAGADVADGSLVDAPPDGARDAGPDADLDARADGGPCAPGSSLYYDTPGCSEKPKCLGDIQDACAGTFCGCDGVTFFGGCGINDKPWAFNGPCADAGDGGEGGSDASADH
jgi:hypothetical protein